MTDERDSSVQDWFTRSMEDMPGQPFAWEVLARVRRRERKLRLQRYAAWCMAAIGFLLLLPRLTALLEWLTVLPLTVFASGGGWPILVLLTTGLALWLARRAGHARSS